MKNTDFVNHCAWEIERLKSERVKVLRECKDRLGDIDRKISSLKEQIDKKNCTSSTKVDIDRHITVPFRDSPNVHVACGMLPSVYSRDDDED